MVFYFLEEKKLINKNELKIIFCTSNDLYFFLLVFETEILIFKYLYYILFNFCEKNFDLFLYLTMRYENSENKQIFRKEIF